MGAKWLYRAVGLAVALVLVGTPASAAAPGASPPQAAGKARISVQLNGAELALAESPRLRNGRVFVPLRGLFEHLGATVSYDSTSGTIRISRGPTVVALNPETGLVERNGEKLLTDVPAFVENERTFVPVRFVVEALGERVEWLSERQVVRVWSSHARGRRPLAEAGATQGAKPGEGGGDQAQAAPVARVPFSEEEFELLARVINAEAYGEPFEGQVAVGSVIINRVLDPNFPDTIKEVIFQPNQFKVVENGQVDRPVSETAYRAARSALYGSDPSGGALYFYNPATSQSDFFSRLTVTARIGDHVFAR
ncbi:MAG TPA: cell wall hydrolase [Bacillota bacterium]